MKEIAGVVVLYYPDENTIIRNISSYLSWVDVLYVVDNSGTGEMDFHGKITGLDSSIIYLKNLHNEGIAAALNKGAELAFESGHRWLLTMDQDSYFDESEITHYFSAFEKYFLHKVTTAVIVPSFTNKSELIIDKYAFSEVKGFITSGSLMNLNVWKESGGFDEKLFIDEVDYEYGYRVQKMNYKIVRFTNIYFNHELGHKREGAYLGMLSNRKRTIHSPERVYFMVRNYLYVRKKYKNLFPEEFKERDGQLLVSLKNNLFFSGRFWPNAKCVIKGCYDFFKGNFIQP